MRCGWLVDDPGYVGGAELTQAEFLAAAPEGVEVIDCRPGEVVTGLDRYVTHNCVHYSPRDLAVTHGAPLVKYVHDVWPAGDPDLRDYLLRYATLIFCSPLHRERFPHPVERDSHVIPPAIDLQSFRPPRQQRNTKREGACAIGSFRHPNKGAQQLVEWAEKNGGLDVYGSGTFTPVGAGVDYKGPLAPKRVAQTLWQYETFVHLPTVLEPFGRCVVEAWAAGCRVVTNANVGARYWIAQEPEKLESAAEDFWAVVLDA